MRKEGLRQQLAELLKTSDSFKRWLSGKGDAVVGVGGAECNCPIAGYMNESLSGMSAEVDRKNLVLRSGEDEELIANVKMPTWGTRFVDKVDDCYLSVKVTARQALNLLEQ